MMLLKLRLACIKVHGSNVSGYSILIQYDFNLTVVRYYRFYSIYKDI